MCKPRQGVYLDHSARGLGPSEATNERRGAWAVPVGSGPEDTQIAMRGAEAFDILLLDGGIRAVHAAYPLERLKDAMDAPIRGCAASDIDQFPPVIPRPPPLVRGSTPHLTNSVEMVRQTLTEG